MDAAIRDIVIVGGGLAAGKAAEAARTEGFDGRLTVIAEEPERPYERPPLSKGFLMGKTPVEEVYVHDGDYYGEHDVDLLLGDPVVELDRAQGTVRTEGGRRLRFDRLLLATGAAPRRLPLGSGLDGVAVLRTLADSRDLVQRLRAVGHVTVIGAGWIGCEVAAAARTLGVEVTMVDPLEVPLARVLGVEAGRVFADLHRAHGVDLRLGLGVTDLEGHAAVESVRLSDGSTVATQLVVMGVGVTPRVELAERAGLPTGDGVLVDATLATEDPRIYAAGDVARVWHPFLQQRIRVEHWANALNQGQAAGRNMVGADEPYDRLPYFYSDQYDLGMEYTGYAEGWDDVVFRGSLEERELIAFWLSADRVVAGMNVNVWDVVEDIQALIRSGGTVPREQLADPDVSLAELAGV